MDVRLVGVLEALVLGHSGETLEQAGRVLVGVEVLEEGANGAEASVGKSDDALRSGRLGSDGGAGHAKPAISLQEEKVRRQRSLRRG